MKQIKKQIMKPKNNKHQADERGHMFQSVPWCFNGHAHTILCSRLFSVPVLQVEKVRISTPDNDFLDFEWMEAGTNGRIQSVVQGRTNGEVNRGTNGGMNGGTIGGVQGAGNDASSAPVVILLHGLEGNARRYYIRRLAEMLLMDGFSVAALHFRSCSGVLNRARRFYHSGETEDLEILVQWVLTRTAGHQPERKIFLAGFSLGASVILNYLAGVRQRGASGIGDITAFAAVSAPFDLKAGSIAMDRGFSKVYQIRFLKSLEKKLASKREVYGDLPEFHGRSLYEFDDQVTAPLHGFEDAEDYYRQCSAGYFLDRIQTPGLFLHSREDPICPFETVPEHQIHETGHFEALFPDRGGHVGFWSMPAGWAELRISEYFQQFLGHSHSHSHSHS